MPISTKGNKMKKLKAKELPKMNNLVAKHMETFNRPATHVDRKKAFKNGKTKHKKTYFM